MDSDIVVVDQSVPYPCPECRYKNQSYIKALSHYYRIHKGMAIQVHEAYKKHRER